jgi:hypothetical protein
LLTIRAIEGDAGLCDAIQVRTFDVTRAIRIKLRTQVIDCEEEDVWSISRGGDDFREEENRTQQQAVYHGGG